MRPSLLEGELRRPERIGAAEAGELAPAVVTRPLQWLLTFHVVCLGWIFFRADSLGTAFDVLGGIAGSAQPNPLVTTLVLLTVGLSIASHFVPGRVPERAQVRFAGLAPGVQAIGLAAALTVIDVLGPDVELGHAIDSGDITAGLRHVGRAGRGRHMDVGLGLHLLSRFQRDIGSWFHG